MTTKRRKIEGRDVETVGAKKALEMLAGPLTLADTLEVIREDLEISKVAMAEKLGVSRSHYNNLVNQQEPVSVKRAKDWAQLLGQSERVFVGLAVQDLLRRNDLNYKVTLTEGEAVG